MKKIYFKKLNSKKILLAMSIAAISISCLSYTRSIIKADTQSDINSANSSKQDLNDKIEETESKIESLKAQSGDVQAYIAELDVQIAEIQNSLNAVNVEIVDINNNIEETEQQLTDAEAKSEEQYEAMKLRIRFMYEHNEESYLAILLSASNMGDLLNKAEYITKISEYDRQMLAEYNDTIVFIADAKSQLEQDKEDLIAKQEELEQDQASANLLAEAKNAELSTLASQTTEQEGYKASLEADRDAQDDLLAQLMAKAAEEEAAKKATVAPSGGSGTAAGGTGGGSSGTTSGTTSGGTSTSAQFVWPTVNTYITSPFGDMADRSSPHKGVDIAPVRYRVDGDPIYAVADGTVIIATYSSSCGNYVAINHGGGMATRYLHCSSLAVSYGQQVKQGQVIAYMGTTGDSTGTHLHFDLSIGSTYVNPMPYFGY